VLLTAAQDQSSPPTLTAALLEAVKPQGRVACKSYHEAEGRLVLIQWALLILSLPGDWPL